MIVAALDLATQTGVAVGPIGGEPVLSTLDLKSKNEANFHGDRLLQIQGLTHRLITEQKVQFIAIEKPFVAAHNDWMTTLLTIGLTANVISWATRKGIPFDIIPAQTVAKHFIGSGKKTRTEKKAAIIAMCRARDWEPQDDNQADAAALWDLMCCRLQQPKQVSLNLSGGRAVATKRKRRRGVRAP